MKKIKILIIIYLEGYKDVPPSEKNFWEVLPSKRIWTKVFYKLNNFKIFVPILFPKKLDNDLDFENIYKKRIEKVISKIYKIYNNFENEEINFKILITGDHDEKDKSILKKREEFASKIKSFLIKHHSDTKIILKRNEKFKLEKLMNIITGKNNIYKKNLKKIYNKKHPKLKDLFPNKNEKEIVDLICENIKKSDHPLFNEIKIKK